MADGFAFCLAISRTDPLAAMLKDTDLIHLPYPPDLSEAGIAQACRSLAGGYVNPGDSILEQMQRMVVETAVELALRRHLGKQGIPFKVLEPTPFSNPGQFKVTLGGHRCCLQSRLISSRRMITRLRKDGTRVLQLPLLVPFDLISLESNKADDILIFAFVLGLTAHSPQDLRRAQQAGQMTCLIHSLPIGWRQPEPWRPLRELELDSECGEPLKIELGGLNERREHAQVELELLPRERQRVDGTFHSVAYLRAARQPERRVSLHCRQPEQLHVVQPRDWGNIWVYGMEILLAGWISRADFRKKAQKQKGGTTLMGGVHKDTKNRYLPVSELVPLEILFEQLILPGRIPPPPIPHG